MRLLLVTLWILSFAKTVQTCRMPVTAICDKGRDPNEIYWEIKDPGNNVLVSGRGGDSKSFCLSTNGDYTVVGRDSVGDGWNGGSLRVVSTSGTLYFGPWTGPTYRDYTRTVTATFNVFNIWPTCKNDEKLYIAHINHAPYSTPSWEISLLEKILS